MSRSYKTSNKTTCALIFINLVLLGSIMLVAFHNPFGAASTEDEVASDYGLQTGLQQIAVVSDTDVNGANADASVETEQPCIIALERNARLSLNMYGASSLVAPDCSIHSHSTSPFGVNLENVEQLKVAAVYSGGSVGRTYDSYGFRLVADSDETENPFADVKTPAISDCDYRDLILKKGDHLLQPGVYCGGLVSLTSETIQLEPGVYTIKNGPLAIGGRANLVGDGVTFVFEGPSAVFSFGVATKLELKAPKTGPLAGIIFFESPQSPKNREFVMRSHDAGLLEGAVYLPRGKFVIDSYGRVGHNSKWSAIVANQIEMINGASLQINTDHEASDIPLPSYLKDPRNLTVALVD